MAGIAKQQVTPLSLPEYELKARESSQFKDSPRALQSLRFGFFGEVGGLLSSVKKAERDRLEDTQSATAAEELGDSLWYLFTVASLLEITPDDLGLYCLDVLRKRFGESEQPCRTPVTFRQIDSLINACTDERIDRPSEMGALAHAAGVFCNISEAQLKAGPTPSILVHFGNLLMELALCCSSFNLHLEDVARSNLEKIKSRWPGEYPEYSSFFDSDYPDYEQLPRNLKMDFIELPRPNGTCVVQQLNGVFIGDPLTDNSNEPDDYRFHDVFHLAYMAYLGWSPVLRGLLRRKRKSQPSTDENEDGARAMIIEEGIATWIFNHAKRRNFYEGIEEGALEYGVLKQIHSMVEGYEVHRCPLWQWERAILKGFEVFREIRKKRSGSVVVNMTDHLLTFEPTVENNRSK
ncbi:nucleoside triphosphate pyrophosphohydrolase family protein [Marinobacterium sp. D7]|uniref:nucleoside triphosphate pyrophosphohydrolase family protein n=1 Tax=Marinobacterium ramblicola TaxID=2849041 RepID=UPI001C2D0C1F|nr:nucleoside triphosphate pyrophosphohydrolase family protein [Marinobacterium ramblicola]MBV1790365.1 nucleoside triphosphate pyrophosphohydrolase family protein [Marinobacterium ramblicola]